MENYVLSGIQDQVAQIKKIPIRKVISEMGFGYVGFDRTGGNLVDRDGKVISHLWIDSKQNKVIDLDEEKELRVGSPLALVQRVKKCSRGEALKFFEEKFRINKRPRTIPYNKKMEGFDKRLLDYDQNDLIDVLEVVDSISIYEVLKALSIDYNKFHIIEDGKPIMHLCIDIEANAVIFNNFAKDVRIGGPREFVEFCENYDTPAEVLSWFVIHFPEYVLL